MTRDLPSWLSEDDEAPDQSAPTRRWLLVGAATLPWLVVVALLATGTGSTGTEPAMDAATPSDASDGEGDAADAPVRLGPDPAEPPDRRPVPELDSSRPRATHDEARSGPDVDPATADRTQEAAALAVMIARSWLTDVGPRLRVEGIDPRPDRYLEQAVVESVEVHGDLAVVGLLAVVLERDDDTYGEVAAHRLAVPVRLAPSGARPAGPPWWLPAPDLEPAPPALETLEDPDLGVAVAEVLASHGYEELEVLRLATHGDGLLVAEITARLGDGRRADGPVWLSPTPAGPALAGASPPQDTSTFDATTPTGSDPDPGDEDLEEHP
jgi:hypothetical protein